MLNDIRWAITYILIHVTLSIMPKDRHGKELLIAIYPWMEKEGQFAKAKLERIVVNISGKLIQTELKLQAGEVAEIEACLNGEYRIKKNRVEPRYMAPSCGVLPIGIKPETFSKLSEEERGYILEMTARNPSL